MARKRVDLIAAHPKPSGRDALWAAMRELKLFTLRDLRRATDVPKRTCTSYLQGLVAGGYLESTKTVNYEPTNSPQPVYELIKDVGVDAPRVKADGTPVIQGKSREIMWRTMKILSEFSIKDLAVHGVKEIDAKDYVRYLAKAEYLARVGMSRPSRYRFLRSMNTGPKPPMVQRIKQVFDANLGHVMWRAGEDKGDGK